MTRPNYTPAYREDGSRLTILGMAASSIGRQSYQVSTCDTCGAHVAWAKSAKTDKWYVCDTAVYSTENMNHRFRAVPYKFHTCRVAPTVSPQRVAAEADLVAAYTMRADARAALVAKNEARSAEDRAMGDD